MNDREPPLIEHDRDEPPKDTSKAPWGTLAIILVLQWGWYFSFHDPDWISIAIGAGTAGIFVAWAIEITGNKVPRSWRGKAPGPRA